MATRACTPPASLVPQADHHSIRSSVPAVCTISEAAQVLTISKRKTCELIASGKLKPLRLGRRVVITREALEKLTGAKLA
jgi:excisionase family DNA binding protein